METNLFGAIWITQAALPFLRAQGSGHIVQVSSVGGVGAFANQSAYHASKWALEAVSESLSTEVGPLGIRVTILEPGAFGTDWAGSSARWSDRMTEYDYVREAWSRGVVHIRIPVTRRRPHRRSWRSSTPTIRRCERFSALPRPR